MEARKIISLILTFILFSSFVSIAENIKIAPLISLDQLEPTYEQEEKEDLNIKGISSLKKIFFKFSAILKT